jgi:hypothetical protein
MTKKSFKWRNVAMIVACLAVSMLFISCDKDNDDNNGNGNGNNGNGKIDHPIVGVWTGHPTSSVGNTNWWMEFRKNGTFTDYFATMGTWGNTVLRKGNFRVTDNIIYCTNVKETYKEHYGNGAGNYTDKTMPNLEYTYKLEYVDLIWTSDSTFTNILRLGIYTEGVGWWYYYHPIE